LDLNELRDNINKVDLEILELIKKRSEFVEMVGHVKSKNSGKIYVPEREKQIFDKLIKHNSSKLHSESIISIFTEIISACRSLEKPLLISFLGPESSYTHSAAIKQFGSSVDFSAQNSIDEVFYNVEKGFSDYGVVPIENSTEGAVNYTLDKFMDSDLKIVAEVEERISHSLLSNEESLDVITKVYSHPQAIAQCNRWLLTNLKNAEIIEVNSTSLAAKLASETPNSAAIASKLAASKYHLNTLSESIEDSVSNTTRFLVIGKLLNGTSGHDKTSIMFSPAEHVGTLFNSLKFFYENNINLSMIESRPNKKTPWQYIFFIDLEGHYENETVKKALVGLKSYATEFKILGSYPKKSFKS
jgi:chorismate mutase / prephenate dehydratase